MLLNYFDGLTKAIEFLIALGSIIGVLGLIVGLLGCLFLSQRQRKTMIAVIAVSIVLLTLCGLHTGLEYFRIN